MSARVCSTLGMEIHNERLRRGWTLAMLAGRARIAISTAQGLEAGACASVETYMRLADALGLAPRFTVLPERAVRAGPDVDPVHAAMGEAEAAHLRRLGYRVLLDEPYQHYQFAGRADLVAIAPGDGALLHLEDRTRFPDIQGFVGAFNGKRAYLASDLAARLGLAPFKAVDHVVVALWSSEVLHALRLRAESFRAVCPDPPDRFARWWSGGSPSTGTASTLVAFDPVAGQRSSRRRWVGLEDVRGIDPRYRGYKDALEALRRAGLA